MEQLLDLNNVVFDGIGRKVREFGGKLGLVYKRTDAAQGLAHTLNHTVKVLTSLKSTGQRHLDTDLMYKFFLFNLFHKILSDDEIIAIQTTDVNG